MGAGPAVRSRVASAASYLLPVALRAGAALARVLPPRLVIGLGAAVGRMAARISSKRRPVQENLRAIDATRTDPRSPGATCAFGVPGRRRDRSAAGVFASYGRYWGEFLVLAARPRWFDERLRRVEGEEHLLRAAAAGPVCALTGHLGNWDLCARFTRRYLAGLSVVAEPLRPEPLFRFFCGVRRRDGGDVLAAEGSGARLYKRWIRGGHVGLVADRVFGAGRRDAPFLGGRRSIPSTGMRLARRAGATLLPIFLVREDGGYVLRAHPPIVAEEEPAAAFARALEQEVLRQPEQWCLLYPAHDATAVAPSGTRRVASSEEEDTGGEDARGMLLAPPAPAAVFDRGAPSWVAGGEVR